MNIKYRIILILVDIVFYAIAYFGAMFIVGLVGFEKTVIMILIMIFLKVPTLKDKP